MLLSWSGGVTFKCVLVGHTIIISEVFYMNHVVYIRMYDVVSIATNTYCLLTIYSHSFYWLLCCNVIYAQYDFFNVYLIQLNEVKIFTCQIISGKLEDKTVVHSFITNLKCR